MIVQIDMLSLLPTVTKHVRQAFCVLASLVCFPLSLPAASLPVGFSETKIADNLNPTTMAFAPDGRLFLCEKQGRILVIQNGLLLPTPMIDFSNKVDSWNERGFGGICIDPDFSGNGYIYVYYTAKSPSHNRVSRFTVVGNTVSPDSEKVILDITGLSRIGWHNGGGVCFGHDGKLYISTGENANGGNAQDTTNLLGKLLRINVDGSIPSDNPNFERYRGDNRAIVALGLRNPFAMVAHPKSDFIYLNNVGAKFEEIERYSYESVPVQINYGWPDLDGPRGGQSAPSGYREPAYAYDHGGGEGTALCGGDFYVPTQPAAGAFPDAYYGRYFFSDYRGWIKYIDPSSPDKRFDFATDIARPIDVETAPDGSLWYIARAGQGGGSDGDNTSTSNGSLWRVRWDNSGRSSKLEFAAAPPSKNLVGNIARTVTVAVKDKNNRAVTSSNAMVTIELGSNPGSAVLSGTLTRPVVEGIATFDDLAIDAPAQGYTLRATSTGLTSQLSTSFDVISKASAPSLSLRSGTYSGPVWIRMHSSTNDATIRYTIDGSNPTSSSATFSAPIPIASTRTVKAFSQKPGLSSSDVSTVHLTISGDRHYGVDFRPEVIGMKMPSRNSDAVPETLSDTGVFRDVVNLTATPGVIPYDVNSPLWSDHAHKSRWLALPGQAQIGFAAEGGYEWPGGTVFVKNFDLIVNEQTNAKRRIETRVLVLGPRGQNGYGVTYKWRPDGRDADLLNEGLDEDIEIVGRDGVKHTQTWHYPSQAECLQCHTTKSGFVLGPNTRQLNGDLAYSANRIDNQIRTWNYLQMFTDHVNESDISRYQQLVEVDDATASLNNRLRSYFDVNCSFCHRPGGTGSQWDGRYDTPFARQNLINAGVRETMGIAGARIVAPGDLAKSVLYLRMTSSHMKQRMPPIGRNVVDDKAVKAVTQWIEAMPRIRGDNIAIVSGRVYFLTAKHSGHRLEVPPGGVTQDGIGLQQWSARAVENGGDRNQQWRLDDRGNNWWRLTNAASGKVLDVPANSKENSVQLQQFRDNGGDNQCWAITDSGEGNYFITSKRSGKNIDVDGESGTNGAAIHQYQNTGNDNQRWVLDLVTPPS